MTTKLARWLDRPLFSRARTVPPPGADAPLFTLKAYDRETSKTSLCRLWSARSAGACRLCPREDCTAQPIRALGMALCFVATPGRIDREAAPLFRHPMVPRIKLAPAIDDLD
jgi:hypothetical protein